MAKRKIATIYDLDAVGMQYFAFSRVRDKATGERGYRYILDKPVTDAQRQALAWAENIVWGTAQYRYAPEIVHDTVILLDHCKKGA